MTRPWTTPAVPCPECNASDVSIDDNGGAFCMQCEHEWSAQAPAFSPVIARTLRHTDTRCQYGLCDSCSAGVANGDWTHLDATPLADETHARITGTLEILGWITEMGAYDPGGYWHCAVCWETCIGSGHVWEGDRPRG